MLQLYHKLIESRFVRRLTVLSGGFLLSQLLIVLSFPILSRLFTPAEFGVYAVFTALTGILGNVLSLRYELAAPVARSDRDAAALIVVALLAVIASCAITVPIALLVSDWLARAAEMPELGDILWAIPLTIVLLSGTETASYWSVYRATFRLNAAARLVQSIAQAGLQVAFGLAGMSGLGMILGYGLGYAARLAYLILRFPPADRARLLGVDRAAITRAARQNWQYPAYSAPATLLEASTALLPAILLAILYDPTIAGLYGLGQRLMGLPVRLFSQAARQVFLSEAANRTGTGLQRLFTRTVLLFLGFGLLCMAPLIVAGPSLFALLFGEAWRSAGEMVQLLVPLYLTRFVVTPVSQALNVLRRQSLHLISSGTDAALLLATFAAAWWFAFAPMTTILLLSLGSTAAYLLYLALVWGVVRSAGRTTTAPPAALPAPSGR
ncbi:MAG: lipopolysaccharide biosynthesis protein [Geminicoccaceae bacterium]